MSHAVVLFWNRVLFSLVLSGLSLPLLAAETGKPVRVFFAGDSTLDNRGGDESTYASWGWNLRHWKKHSTTLDVRAKSGYSTPSFRSAGYWGRLLNDVQSGDWVVIQFGHNDQGTGKKGFNATMPEYTANLRRMIGEVRAKRAKPLVCTSIVRRTQDAKGCLVEEPDENGKKLSDYAAAARAAAKAENCPCVDMNALTTTEVRAKGVDSAAAYYAHADRSHPNVQGARRFAELFLRDVRERQLEIAGLFEENDAVVIKAGGTVGVPGSTAGFMPSLNFKEWGAALNLAAAESDFDGEAVTFELVAGRQTRATGRMSARREGDGWRFTLGWTCLEDCTVRGAGLNLDCDVDEFAGLAWGVDDKRQTFPAESGTDVIRLSGKSFRIDAPGQKGTYRLSFDDGVGLMFKDNRNAWPHTPSYTIGIGPGKDHAQTFKKGESGSISFTLVREDANPFDVTRKGKFVFAANERWIPFLNHKDIVKGSALDLSSVIPRHEPAGKYGWLRANGPEFEFAGKPGESQRFYGVNICNGVNFPNREMALAMAERFRRTGYNALRIHHHERYCTRVVDGRIEFIPEMIDALDFFVAECIKRGIYFTTDLFVSRPVTWKDLGVDKPGKPENVKTLFMTWEPAYRNWCEFARLFLSHVNPYTGRAYKDEPAMPFIVLVNEANFNGCIGMNLKQPGFRECWRDWLTAERRKNPTCYPGFEPDKDPPDRAFWDWDGTTAALAAFYAHVEGTFNRRATKFLREELGVKALLTGQNFGPIPAAVQAMREETVDYTDSHFYVDISRGVKNYWSRPSQLDNRNVLCQNRSVLDGYGWGRLWDKPFCISEWNFCPPGQFRGLGTLLTGVMAAKQGWNGIWRFDYSSNTNNVMEVTGLVETFDTANDPVLQASDRAFLTLFLRRDMPMCEPITVAELTEHSLDPTLDRTWTTAPQWSGFGAGQDYAWSTRVGAIVRGRPVPKGAACHPIESIHELDRQLPFEKSSNTAINRVRGAFRFVSERSSGGFVPAGGKLVAGPLEARVLGAKACVWASTLDGAALAKSRRILLVHLPDVQSEGLTYQDETRRINFGTKTVGRYLAEAGTAQIALAVAAPERLRVRALKTDGSFLADVPSHVENGRLVFTASVKGPSEAQLHYEIAVR